MGDHAGQLDAVNNNPGGFDLNASQRVDGWTAGGGVEYMLWSNLSLGVEYNYYQFSVGNFTNITNTGGVVISCAFCNFGTTSLQTVTGRVNVKLWGGEPWGALAAKY